MKEATMIFIRKGEKGTKTFQNRGDFVYSVNYLLKTLYNTSHDNDGRIIKRCALIYMHAWIYNQPLLLDYR